MTSLPDVRFISPQHKAHYEFQMNQYCKSGKGIVFALPPSNQYGDIASDPDYSWTSSAQEAWRERKVAPAQPGDLDFTTKLATWTYHVPRAHRVSDNDTRITKRDFERLEATPTATCSMWQVSAEYVALMPLSAIVFTDMQKRAYRDGTYTDESAPCIGDCLKVGFRPQDLNIAPDGTKHMPGQGEMTLTTAAQLVESLGS